MERLKHGENAEEAAKVIVRLLLPYKKHVKTITTDNGSEFSAHTYVTEKIKAPVFFADPSEDGSRSLSGGSDHAPREHHGSHRV